MSIVKMQKVAVLGLDTVRSNLMTQLMNLEAVELTDQTDKLEDEFIGANLVQDDGQEKASYYEAKIARAGQALEVIEKYGDLKNPLFQTRRIVKSDKAEMIPGSASLTDERIEKLISLNEEIRKANDRINKIDSDVSMLTPWVGYEPNLRENKTRTTAMLLGTVPRSQDESFEAFIKTEEEFLNGSCILKEVSRDNDSRYVAVVCLDESNEELQEKLKDVSFNRIDFSEFDGTANEILEKNKVLREQITESLNNLVKEVKENVMFKESIEDYSDILSLEMDKERIRSKLLSTKRSFMLEGWIPEPKIEECIKILDENECIYKFREPLDGEEVPVLLKNSEFFRPIEAVTEMYSLPAYGSFDPTSIYALFYICFFGMMFSDACYGIIMAVACWIVLKKFNLEGTTYKMIKGFFYCGISTAFWGVMYGGWFGDFFEVFARVILNKELDIPPLWFDPLDDPLKLLIFSLGFGIVHIFIGMGIKAYMQIRDGRLFDALCDEGFWYLTITGCIMWLAGAYLGLAIAGTGKWLAIVGVLGLLLTGGRDRKGFGKVIGGLSNVYNITSYMSDILSYARILALGLATGVIAQVVNTMGSLGGGGVLGCIVLLIVFVVGHVLNFAINVLGAFIHASRLQYVEFFGKFYEDGGEPFNPFRKKTQYIKIESQEDEIC